MTHSKIYSPKITRLLMLVVWMFAFVSGYGQPPYSACFTTSLSPSNKACAPVTVNVTSCSPSGPLVGLASPVYYYDFINSPADFTQTTSRVYTSPGIYVIRQGVNDGISTTVFTTQTIQVLTTPQPNFTVSLCQGNIARLTINDNVYDEYLIDFGDGNPTTTVLPLSTTNYTYTVGGSYTVTVAGRYLGACTGPAKTQNITTINSLQTPDILQLEVMSQAFSGGSLELKYNTRGNIQYRIEQKTNSGAYALVNTVQNAGGVTVTSVGSLNTQNNTYCFRLQEQDGCANTSSYSQEICNVIVSPTALNNQNQVGFNTYAGPNFDRYDMTINSGTPIGSVTSLYNHTPVNCGTNYCYKTTAYLTTSSLSPVAAHKSISASVCVTAISTNVPAAPQNINTTYTSDNTLSLVWDPVSPFLGSYIIQKSINGSPFGNYKSITSNTSSYNEGNPNDINFTNCYQMMYRSECNINSAISNSSCPSVLSYTQNGDDLTLTWTPYTGYNSTGIQGYVVEELDNNDQVIKSTSVGLTFTYTTLLDPTVTEVNYRVRVASNGTENVNSVTNRISLDFSPQLYIPNVFSPNGDGQNDVFSVSGKYFKDFKMTIFNRWGEMVFHTNQLTQGWDGTYKGTEAITEAYAYTIEASDNEGKKIVRKGSVSLIR